MSWRDANPRASSFRKAGVSMGLEQLTVVRVRRRFRDPADYDGWRLNQRPPHVGDVGTIVEVLHAEGLPDCYVVESADENGMTIWLADFTADELEPFDG